MTKDVLLTISGLQFDASHPVFEETDEHEPVEIVTTASYYEKDGTHYLFYDEVEEGLEGVTKNRITVNQKTLEINKSGSINSHLVFEDRRRTGGIYDTPFGRIQLGITSGEIILSVEPDSIRIALSYALDVNNEPLLTCELNMQVLPRSSAGAILSGGFES